MKIRDLCIALFMVSAMVCAVSLWSQEVTLAKYDNKEVLSVDYPVPSTDCLPCDYISAQSLTVTSNAVVTLTVPSTTRRMLVQANGPIHYSWANTTSHLSPPLASGSKLTFTGIYSDLDDVNMLGDANDYTVQAYYFKK